MSLLFEFYQRYQRPALFLDSISLLTIH